MHSLISASNGIFNLFSAVLDLRPLAFSAVLLIFSGVSALAVSMRETVAKCTGIVQDFTRIRSKI
jgi:hypothetical protein